MNRTPVPASVQDVRPGSNIRATEPQQSYLEKLKTDKDLSTLAPEQRAWLADADFNEVSKAKASDIITQLKELPWKPRENDSPIYAEMRALGVKTGRYAIPPTAQQIAGDEAHSPGADSALRFYSVKVTDNAVWVDVWASDARYPIKAAPQRLAILKAIAADPDSGPRFGREIGRCYVCNRTLTDETSRSLGIGPVCRGDE